MPAVDARVEEPIVTVDFVAKSTSTPPPPDVLSEEHAHFVPSNFKISVAAQLLPRLSPILLAICRQREAVESYISITLCFATSVRSLVRANRFAAAPVAPSSFFSTIGLVPTFIRVMMRPSAPPARLVMLRDASELRRSTEAVARFAGL